jgi:phosphoribosylformimino-5-aminoimidazole carboxamide ribotide isomerase
MVEFYVADLDAIDGGIPDFGFLGRASAHGLHAWIDAGLRDSSGVEALIAAGAGSLVAATETLGGPGQLAEIVRVAGSEPVVFGIDLREESPITLAGSSWRTDRPESLIDEALKAGIRRVLVLDMNRIGSGRGIGMFPLIRDLIGRVPGVEVTVGGGIAGIDDILLLADLGVSAVLVGSALHDGRLGLADLLRFRRTDQTRLPDR